MNYRRLSIGSLFSQAVVCCAAQRLPATGGAAGAALLPDVRLEQPKGPRITVDQDGGIDHTLAELDDGAESSNGNWVNVRLFNNARNVHVIR